MNNVYVGERYVPVVYGEWNDRTDFETLTIVTSNGSGYISKKRVPKNTPVSNTDYWALLYQGGTGGSVVTWESIIGKPTSFPSSWDSISGKPTNFPVSWDSITNKPSSFPSSWSVIEEKPEFFPTSWNEVSGKPSTFNSTWDKIANKPNTFPSTWEEISGKPQTFLPSKHTHTIYDIYNLSDTLTSIKNQIDAQGTSIESINSKITSIESNLDNKANKALDNVSNDDFYNKGIECGLAATISSITWDKVTGKPSQFPPSPHTHTVNDIEGLTQTLSAINGNITAINSSIESINSSITSFNTRLTNTQNTVGQQTIAISNLQANQTTFNNQLQSLSTSLNSKANVSLDNVTNEVFKAKAIESGVGGGSPTWDNITGKPTEFPTSWELIKNIPASFPVSWADISEKPQYFPTSWENISNIPTSFPVAWETITNKPSSFPTTWNDISDKPTSFPVSWDDITGKPDSFPVSWNAITGKPTQFAPAPHTHTIQEVDTLDDTLTHFSDDIVQANSTATQAFNKAVALESSTMLKPTNSGSSENFLMWQTNNRGVWTGLPIASSVRNGLMTPTLYNKVSKTLRYVVEETVSSNGFAYRRWSDDFVEMWKTVSVSSLSVSTALGSLYRSKTPITMTEYKYPFTFISRPKLFCTFYSTNNASAMVWLNPTSKYALEYLPPLYLVRPTTGTCTGDLYFYICGDT